MWKDPIRARADRAVRDDRALRSGTSSREPFLHLHIDGGRPGYARPSTPRRCERRRAARQPRVPRAGRSREPWPTWVEDSRYGGAPAEPPRVSAPPSRRSSGYRGPMSHRTRVILVVAVARGRGRRGRRRRVVRRRRRARRRRARRETRRSSSTSGCGRIPRRAAPARGRQALARRLAARAEFAGGRSLQAEAGEAISAWPDGTLERLEDSRRSIPGAAPCCSTSASPGSGAETRPAPRRGGDALAGARHGVRRAAGDLLFRGAARSPDVRSRLSRPREVRAMEAPEQFAALGGWRGGPILAPSCSTGALQRVERPVSARREFSAAAKLAPNDADALVADAIGRFDKSIPSVPSPAWARSRGGSPGRHRPLPPRPDAAVARRPRGSEASTRPRNRLGPPHDMEAKRLLDRLEGIRES